MTDNANKSDKDKLATVTIYIDDKPYQVSTENNLLAGVLSNKLDLPYFCWHPSMGSVGACRQCAVTQYHDENDQRGRMVMACMTPVVDGMRIGLQDQASATFREQVIAAMMTNHPHDCPVCAEGGECHLQDMTVMTGHTSRQYPGEKRTFTNQYLGELVGHEMNRCITCYRCVRFYKDYAGGKDFDVYGSRNQVYFGRQKDGILQSPFSGNLVEVCPTGVFTNKPFSAHYTRKWDLQSSPSVCSFCSVGCNTSIGERYGSIRRVMNRYNHDINGYFLCDRGRFGLGTVNLSKRIKAIKGLGDSNDLLLNTHFSQQNFTKKLTPVLGEQFIGIGSASASFESNRLLKYVVGKENFSLGYSNNEMQLALRHKQLLVQYPQQSLAGMENLSRRGHGELAHDLVLIIGEDLEQTAPRLALSVKQILNNAAVDKADSIGVKHWQDSAVRTYAAGTMTPLFSLQAKPTNFDELALTSLVLSPDDIVLQLQRLIKLLDAELNSAKTNEVVFSLNERLREIEGDVNNVDDSDNSDNSNNSGSDKGKSDEVNIHDNDLALIAKALVVAKAPLLVTGLSLKSAPLLKAVDNLMACLSQQSHGNAPELTVVAPQCNSVGNLHFFSEQMLSVEQILKRLTTNESLAQLTGEEHRTSLLVLEQDLAQYDEETINSLTQHCRRMIVLSSRGSRLTEVADIVLPVADSSEGEGHYVNYQGRLQAFYPAYLPNKPVLPSWQYLQLLAKCLFKRNEIEFTSMRQLHQYFAKHGEPWALQILTCETGKSLPQQIARQTHRASGRTATMANQSVHEQQTFNDAQANLDGMYRYSMEGKSYNSPSYTSTDAPSLAMPFSWSPAWNSNQSILKHQSQVNGELLHRQQDNFLHLTVCSYFDDNERVQQIKLAMLWPTTEEGKQATKSKAADDSISEQLVNKNSSNEPEVDIVSKESDEQQSDSRPLNSLSLVQNLPWYLVSEQSKLLPEFILMYTGNTFTISSTVAKTFGGLARDIFKVNIASSTYFGSLVIDESLPDNIMLVSIFELSFDVNNVDVALENITKANDIEETRFTHTEKQRVDSANQEKSQVLAKLKQQDQTIPISFYEQGEKAKGKYKGDHCD